MADLDKLLVHKLDTAQTGHFKELDALVNVDVLLRAVHNADEAQHFPFRFEVRILQRCEREGEGGRVWDTAITDNWNANTFDEGFHHGKISHSLPVPACRWVACMQSEKSCA